MRASRKLLVLALAASLFAVASPGVAKDKGEAAKEKGKVAPAEKTPQGHLLPYLGVAIEVLPADNAGHLPSTLAKGQGIWVAQVAGSSPAAKAGVKEHDVLATYDGQKLFSPNQLARLVQSDKPGHEAMLGIVRDGKLQNLKATLGQREVVETATAHGQRPLAERFTEHPQTASGENPWERFDSMTLKKVGDNRFQIEIQYLNDRGKMEHHAFQGTRREIRRAIHAEKDLPPTERRHLLSSLNMGMGPKDWASQVLNEFPSLDEMENSDQF